MYTWMYILLLWSEMLWRYQLNLFDLVFLLRPLSSCCLLSGRSIHWSQWGVKIPYCNCITVDLSLYVHQDLLYIFRCPFVGCMNVYNSYILFLDCSLVGGLCPAELPWPLWVRISLPRCDLLGEKRLTSLRRERSWASLSMGFYWV